MTDDKNDIKPLYIPPAKKVKGLVVFCHKCKTNVFDKCRKSGKSIKHCPNGDRHVFKVYSHIPGTKYGRKTKNLQTRDLDEAIIQALEFEREVKKNIPLNLDQPQKTNETIAEVKIEPRNSNTGKIRPNLLIHALARYIGFLNNEGVPPHMVKERSPEHIKDVERSFRLLAESLKSRGHDLTFFSIENINDEAVGHIYSHMEELHLANRTFNKNFSYYTSFLKWYSEEYNYPVKNYFERVQRKMINTNPEAITQKEYEALLKQVTPENGTKEYTAGIKTKRNVYRSWLADGIRLGLETGFRRENIISFKWSDVKEDEGIPYIQVENFKVNHIQKLKTKEEKKYIYTPVTENLLNLLNQLGYKEYKESDKYILAPEVNLTRKREMFDILSRGFTHYYEQLNTDRKLTFKSLRKAYITSLGIYLTRRGDIKNITGHSNDGVIERNYIDKKEMAKSLRRFKVFPKEHERVNDLKEIRTNTKNEIKNISQELNIRR